MDTTNMTITDKTTADKTTADLSGTISFPGSIINTTPNPYIGMANSVGTTVTNLKNELEQRIAALESVTSYLLSKVSELENKVDNLTSRISELENPNRCKLDPEIGAVICDL